MATWGSELPGAEEMLGPHSLGPVHLQQEMQIPGQPLRTVCTWVPGTWGVLQFWKRKRSRGRSLASPGDCALGQDWPREGPSCHLYQDQGVLRIPPVPCPELSRPLGQRAQQRSPLTQAVEAARAGGRGLPRSSRS